MRKMGDGTPRAPFEIRGFGFTQIDGRGGYIGQGQLVDAHAHNPSYGTGIFEGISPEFTPTHAVIMDLGAHMARLLFNAHLMFDSEMEKQRLAMGYQFETPLTIEEVYRLGRENVQAFPFQVEVLGKNGLQSLGLRAAVGLVEKMMERNLSIGFGINYLRPLVIKGDLDRELRPAAIHVLSSDHTLEWMVHGYRWPPYLGGSAAEEGISVMVPVESVLVEAPNSLGWIKTSPNYGAVRTPAKNVCTVLGFKDTLLLGKTREGSEIATELSGANIFMVKDGVLATPRLNYLILPGITRDNILHMARILKKEIGIRRVEEKDIKLEELLGADEVFAVGTASKVIPIVKFGLQRYAGGEIKFESIALRSGSPGPVTRAFQAAYFLFERGWAFEIEGNVVDLTKRTTRIVIPSSQQERLATQIGVKETQTFDLRFRVASAARTASKARVVAH